jgi:Zn finger protein HypA/HybF involved in hydrogenase expression
MIPKGLKQGETFIDEGRKYKVLEVVAEGNYISQAVDSIEEEEPKELKCQYCGKVCKNALGLASHEEHCKENPKNQGA